MEAKRKPLVFEVKAGDSGYRLPWSSERWSIILRNKDNCHFHNLKHIRPSYKNK